MIRQVDWLLNIISMVIMHWVDSKWRNINAILFEWLYSIGWSTYYNPSGNVGWHDIQLIFRNGPQDELFNCHAQLPPSWTWISSVYAPLSALGIQCFFHTANHLDTLWTDIQINQTPIRILLGYIYYLNKGLPKTWENPLCAWSPRVCHNQICLWQ